MKVIIEFGGGLELLFKNKKRYEENVPDELNMKGLIQWMSDNLLQERKELFIKSGSVTPGILVLINDADWELEGELEYKLVEGDTIVFISTLH
ncbi:hypothetical protein HDV02_004971, partial [Globomyces sp. JEL0801]